MKFLLVFFIVLITSSPVFAQPKITSLTKDRPAPFSGILLSPEAFAELEVKTKTSEQMFKILLERETSLLMLRHKLELDNEQVVRKVREELFENRLKIKDEHIKWLELSLLKTSETTWWDRWKFEVGIGVGIVSTSVAVYLGVKALEGIK